MSYARELKMPSTPREGLANQVQIIINELENNDPHEALLLAVDLLDRIVSTHGLDGIDENAGRSLLSLTKQFSDKHQAELTKTRDAAYLTGRESMRTEITERLFGLRT